MQTQITQVLMTPKVLVPLGVLIYLSSTVIRNLASMNKKKKMSPPSIIKIVA